MTVECFRFAKPGSTGRDGRPFYVYARRGPHGWNATSQAGIGEAWSNFADDAEMMRLAMDRCASAELAAEAFKRYARRGYTTEII
jgi:hypothetical protein